MGARRNISVAWKLGQSPWSLPDFNCRRSLVAKLVGGLHGALVVEGFNPFPTDDPAVRIEFVNAVVRHSFVRSKGC